MQIGELWVKLGLDKSNFDNGMNDTKSKASGLGGIVKNALSFTIGAGMFDIIKTGIKAAWDTSIGYNSQMQQSQAAFTTLLGNGSKAATMLSQLSKMAADTPFELNDLNKASQTLLGFGIDSKKVMPDLKMLGDISMGNKDKLNSLTLAFAQIQSAGKLTGQDLLQLINAGFNPLQTMSKQTGLSMAELKDKMSKGAISADMVTSAFQSATAKGGLFYGAMDKQSKTFEGQMSTMGDNVKSTLGGILKPQFEYLTNTILPAAIDKVGKFGAAFKSGGLGAALKTILPAGLVDGLTSLGNAIKGIFGWVEQHGPLIKTVLAGITAGFVAYKIAVMASIVQQEISNALEAIAAIRAGKSAVMMELEAGMKGKSTVAQWLLNTAMNANVFAIVVIAIIALIGALIYLWNTNAGFRTAVINIWNSVKNAIVGTVNAVVGFVKNNWKQIALFLVNPVAGAIALLYNNNPRFKAWADNVGANIKNGFNSAINWIKNLPANMLAWGKDMMDGLINGIKSKINGIGDAVKGVGNKIKSFLHFSTPDEGPLRDYEKWTPDMIEGMAKGIDNSKNTLIDKIKGLAGNMALNVKGNLTNTALAGGSTSTINLYGNYGFKDKDDMSYFLNQLALIVKGKR